MSELESPLSPAADMEDQVADVCETQCCVVGGGPAGVVLSLLLARNGVNVTLLESHKDFNRDFRGDTIHPSTLEILDQLGLVEGLQRLPHGTLHSLRIHTQAGERSLVDFRRLKTKFPYIMMLPQARFLDYLATAARQYSEFKLVFGANVQRLVEDGDSIEGVRYRGEDSAWHEVRAPLTVACDGRFSKLRTLAGFNASKTSPPMDVVWCRVTRRPEQDPAEGDFYIRRGHFAVILNRDDHWQIGYVILKGDFPKIRAAGIEMLQQSIAEIVPWLADRVQELHDWKQTSVLSVESSLLERWYRRGLLLLGDAAHVMTPVGGVGINYAVQDAVEAANLLTEPLHSGRVSIEDLAAVQRRRERPTRVIQAVQRLMQRMIVSNALQEDKPFDLPLPFRLLMRVPGLRDIPARIIAFGPRRVHVVEALQSSRR